jgi:hypothetical protein
MDKELFLERLEKRIIKKMMVLNQWREKQNIETRIDLEKETEAFQNLYNSNRENYIELSKQLDMVLARRVELRHEMSY